MTEAALAAEVRRLSDVVLTLCRHIGPRLTREQVCTRLDVSRNTLTRRVDSGQFPRPGADGKWLLSEVLEWESRTAPLQPTRNS